MFHTLHSFIWLSNIYSLIIKLLIMSVNPLHTSFYIQILCMSLYKQLARLVQPYEYVIMFDT